MILVPLEFTYFTELMVFIWDYFVTNGRIPFFLMAE